MNRFAPFLAALLIFIPVSTQAAGDFGIWLQNLRAEALQKGISQTTVNQALADIQPLPRVIELDRKQPEGTMTFAKYQKTVISQARMKPFIVTLTLFPHRTFVVIERRVGHVNFFHAGKFHATRDMFIRVLRSEPFANGRQVALFYVQPERV